MTFGPTCTKRGLAAIRWIARPSQLPGSIAIRRSVAVGRTGAGLALGNGAPAAVCSSAHAPRRVDARVAQSVEQLTRNEQVRSSILLPGSVRPESLADKGVPAFPILQVSNTGDAAKTATVRGSAEFGTTASDRVLSIPAGSTRLIRVDQTAS